MLERPALTASRRASEALVSASRSGTRVVTLPVPSDTLLGATLSIDTRGCTTVTHVLPAQNAYHLRGVREALSLSHLAHEGAAVSLGSGVVIGNATILPPAKTPHWLARNERSCKSGILDTLFGRLDVFPKHELKPGSLEVTLPENITAPSSAMRYFCIEMCGAVLAVPFDDARRELATKGFTDTRWFERGESLAIVTVSPDKRAIIVAWRCAADVTTLIGALDRRTVDDGRGERVLRGVNRYIGQIREPLNAYLSEVMAKHPEARLVLTSNSLGGAAIVQWVEQEIAAGLIPQKRIAQVTVFNPQAGLGPERSAALAKTLGERLDVVVNKRDWVRWLFGLDRSHKGHASYIDAGSSWFNRFGLPSIKNAVEAHLLSPLRRVFKRDLKPVISASPPARSLPARPEENR